jgi:hypothetical protein
VRIILKYIFEKTDGINPANDMDWWQALGDRAMNLGVI